MEIRAADATVEINGLARSPSVRCCPLPLTIVQSSTAGTANMTQSGDVAVIPGAWMQVGEMHLHHARDASFVARLELEWENGEPDCNFQARSQDPF